MENVKRTTIKIDDIPVGTYVLDKIRYGKTKDNRDYACIDFDNDKTTFVQSYNINAIKNIIAVCDTAPSRVTFLKYTATTGKQYTRFKFSFGV